MANEKKKNNGLGLPQTRGTFQIKGITIGTQKDSFYKETLTKKAQKITVPMDGLGIGEQLRWLKDKIMKYENSEVK